LLTITVTLAVAFEYPLFAQVISNMYVDGVIPDLNSDPPVAVYEPLHQLEAVHESAAIDGVQVNVVEPE